MSGARPNIRANAATVCCSTSAAIEPTSLETFWSYALASQSPASPAGLAPPVTKPK